MLEKFLQCSNALTLNSNIRCIEIVERVEAKKLKKALNSNIRCIEMLSQKLMACYLSG